MAVVRAMVGHGPVMVPIPIVRLVQTENAEKSAVRGVWPRLILNLGAFSWGLTGLI